MNFDIILIIFLILIAIYLSAPNYPAVIKNMIFFRIGESALQTAEPQNKEPQNFERRYPIHFNTARSASSNRYSKFLVQYSIFLLSDINVYIHNTEQLKPHRAFHQMWKAYIIFS